MIMEMDIRCHFYGEKFSPKKVEQLTGFTLENKIEVGDILHKGKTKESHLILVMENYVPQMILEIRKILDFFG